MMRHFLIVLGLLGFMSLSHAQKIGYVDTEYILKNIPTFEAAQKQLDEYSANWQKEIELVYAEVQRMYKEYKAEQVLLTEELKIKRQAEIAAKEKEAKDLQKKYFGQEGELFVKRQELIKPIQDDVYNAVKEVSVEANIEIMFDASGGTVNLLYANPKLDRSDDVLIKLGYKK